MRKPKQAAALLLALTLMISVLLPVPVAAKTLESAKGENIFFYAQNADGKDVLLKIVTLKELEALSHGQLSNITSGTDTGKNYYISATDNYPTTQYGEGRGFTISELVDYIKSTTTVSGVSSLNFSGNDTMRFMATDSYGNYTRAWTYDELYGVKRYYFEGLFDTVTGWKSGWEIAGEENSKYGFTVDEYNSTYKDSDPYYADKQATFATGVESIPILSTQSYSGRTTSSTLVSSTEPGISHLIAANGGVVAGSLEDSLTDEHALRLLLPITEADLMSAHRTAFDNFKWIYNLKLDMATLPQFKSQGTVAAPQASVSLSGNTLTISISCATQGAQIYYSYDGAPQIPYTGPLTVDVSGRDLASDPVTFYMTAVREGWDDAGVTAAKYPGLAPVFNTVYSSMVGEDLVFQAADTVSDAEWSAWKGALTSVMMKTPTATGYLTVDPAKYTINDAAKTITFDKSLFSEMGQCGFIFCATKYANKSVFFALKKSVPEVIAADTYTLGGDLLLTFQDTAYQDGLNVYIKPSDGNQTLISTTYLDRSVSGQVTVKAAYFSLASCPVTAPGEYTLILSNSKYSPDSLEVPITLTGGFTDVPASAWYYGAVNYAVEAGLFQGTSATTFSPETGMTRAMFVTTLGRLAQVDTTAYRESKFSDVEIDGWYGPYVAWAEEAGIVEGVGGGQYAPNEPLTREQLISILYRYTKAEGADDASLSAFSDAGDISGWARNAFAWAVSAGVINGSNGALLPGGTVTRAQTAQIMMNYAKIAE